MSEPARKAPAYEESADGDPFRLGWRYRAVRLPDGRTELREEPLTAADLLDPQLGDHVTQNSWHVAAVHELWDILSWRYESRPDVFVSCDLKMLWRIRGLPNPSPDIAVIPGVRDKTRFRRSFDVRREDTRPVLVIEFVSDEPEHQSADHDDKVRIYERAGIAEYLIVDPPNPACRLTGYRLDAAGRYRLIPPDAEGGLLSAATGVRFQVAPEGRSLHLFDAVTGERLLSSSEVRRELERLRSQLG
ncbi:MAG TPA: Uma2 family endonuclease [Thermoanaerobaculia bacterium]|nr:Uma2 family endonuclease [Thermoanaerobaculia bacterium]